MIRIFGFVSSARDFDDLLLRDRKRTCGPVQIEIFVTELGERGTSALAGLAPVHPAERRGLGAEQNVFLRAQMQREIQLLINHRDAL
jgi:hypothetical protein